MLSSGWCPLEKETLFSVKLSLSGHWFLEGGYEFEVKLNEIENVDVFIFCHPRSERTKQYKRTVMCSCNCSRRNNPKLALRVGRSLSSRGMKNLFCAVKTSAPDITSQPAMYTACDFHWAHVITCCGKSCENERKKKKQKSRASTPGYGSLLIKGLPLWFGSSSGWWGLSTSRILMLSFNP